MTSCTNPKRSALLHPSPRISNRGSSFMRLFVIINYPNIDDSVYGWIVIVPYISFYSLIYQFAMLDLQIPEAAMWYRSNSERCERFSPQHSITHSCNKELHLACKVFDWTLSQHAYGSERSGRASGSNCNKTLSRWRGCFPYKENGSQNVSISTTRVLFPILKTSLSGSTFALLFFYSTCF